MGPITIFDKSALQALSIDEAVWLDAFFSANVVPLFYVETLADLEKEVAKGRTPEDVVGSLAAKTPSSALPNVHHEKIIASELLGNEIEMRSLPMVEGTEEVQIADGRRGLRIDEFPEAAALLRWGDHEFAELEREVARGWRAQLAAHDPDRMTSLVQNILPSDRNVSDLEQLKEFIDGFCSSADEHVLQLAFEVLGVPTGLRRYPLRRWQEAGRPPVDGFAPYLTHVFKVDLLYYLGIARGFISGERASNKVDMAYLYYLPFTMIFTSGDNLHKRTAPLFLRPDQSYVPAPELKAGLAEVDAYYWALPQTIKDLGVMRISAWPPSTLDNLVTQLWDKHMIPTWREEARKYEARLGQPRDLAADAATIAELKSQMASAQPAQPAQPGAGTSDDGDFAFLRRRVPTRMGRWQMLPQDDEDSSEDA